MGHRLQKSKKHLTAIPSIFISWSKAYALQLSLGQYLVADELMIVTNPIGIEPPSPARARSWRRAVDIAHVMGLINILLTR